MAIVKEGFSIREYTSKMRSTDVEKCWPFGKASEEVVRATLPPMTVEKFSWWFDKLGLAHHDDEDDGDETLESLRRKRGKAKSKAPKKRSVVELFAAVPQVERVSYSSEDGEGSGDGDDKLPIPKKKVGKEKVVMLKDLKRGKVTKKKNVAVDSSAVKKKDKASDKLKLHSSADVATICNSSMYRKDLFDGFATHLKKPRMKRSSPQKSKFKTSSNYKFLPNDQHKGLAVHGSLKTQSRLVAAENYSNPRLPDARNSSNCDTGHANKNVSFSAVKDVLKPSWKACPTMRVSDLGMNSDFIVDSSANRHVSTNVMNHAEEERTRFSKDKFVVRQVTEKPLSSRHYGSDGSNYFSGQHDYSQANLFSKLSVPYGEGSQHSQSHGRVTLHEELYSCSYSRDSFSSNPRLLDLSGCAGPMYDSDSSMDFMKNYPRPPTTYHSPAYNNVTSSPFFPSRNIGKNHCEQALSSQWIPHLSPQEMIHSSFSLPDWNSRASSRYKETSINKNFVGLPLNSLGELMSMNSRGRDGFSHTRNAVEGPSYSSGMHRNVLSNPNMIEHCLSDLYGVGKSNSDKDAFDPCLNLIDSVVERLKVFHIDCRPRDHVQELRGNDVIRKPDHHISLQVTRSTMRLMGKNFTVEDREGSTAKHTISGHRGGSGTRPSSSISCHEKSPRYVVHPILGKLRETVSDFPKPKTNRAFENNSESKVSSQFLGSHNNVRRNQNDVTKGREILMPEFHPQGSLPCSPSPNSYKYSTLSSAHHSHPESSWISIPTSTLSGSSQNARTRSNVPGAGKYFPLKVPFSDSTSDRRVVHPPWSHNSLRGTAPYVLTSREKRTLMTYCHPSSVSDNICYPYSISGANYGTKGSAISRPQSFHPCNFPARPGFSMPARRGPRYFLDNQMQSRLSIRVPGHEEKSKRRLPSAPNIGSNKPPKIPKIRVQDDCSNAVVDLEASSSFQGDFEPFEPSSSVGELRGQSVVHEPVGAPRSGPVKLTAGSRYVLKPSRKNDLENSEPNDSTSTSRVVASNVVECEKSSEARMF